MSADSNSMPSQEIVNLRAVIKDRDNTVSEMEEKLEAAERSKTEKVLEQQSQNDQMYQRLLEKSAKVTAIKGAYEGLQAECANNRKLMASYVEEIRNQSAQIQKLKVEKEDDVILIRTIKCQKSIAGICLSLRNMEVNDVEAELAKRCSEIQALKLSKRETLKRYEDLRKLYINQKKESAATTKISLSRAPIDAGKVIGNLNTILSMNTTTLSIQPEECQITKMKEIRSSIEDLVSQAIAGIRQENSSKEASQGRYLVAKRRINIDLETVVQDGKCKFTCKVVNPEKIISALGDSGNGGSEPELQATMEVSDESEGPLSEEPLGSDSEIPW